jgi:hypothetical protein
VRLKVSSWRTEVTLRRREAVARAQIRVVDRTFRRHPNAVDRLAAALLRRAAAHQVENQTDGR